MNTNSVYAEHHFIGSEKHYDWRNTRRAFLFNGAALVGLCFLTAEVSRSQSDIPHSVGLLWMSDQPVAKTSTLKHTKLARDTYMPRRDSNSQFQ